MTIDKSRRKAKPHTLPQFTPVPRHCNRHDGWTPDRQQRFIEALADLGSVKAAAHRVNMAPEGAYHLRRHPEAGEFRRAWKAALALGVQQLEDVAMERALHGVEVPVYSYGKLIGSRVVHNDRLLMFLLRNRAPKRFGEGGRMNLADRATLANLKRQWRKQWEREEFDRALEQSHRARAGIDEKITRWAEQQRIEIARSMRAEWLRLGGPPSIPGDPEEEVEEDWEELEEDEAGAPTWTPPPPLRRQGPR